MYTPRGSNWAKLTLLLCEPLVHALIEDRHKDPLRWRDCRRKSTFVHPKCKLDCVDDPVEKFRLITMLKNVPYSLDQTCQRRSTVVVVSSSNSKYTIRSIGFFYRITSTVTNGSRRSWFFLKTCSQRDCRTIMSMAIIKAVQPQLVKISDEVDR